MLHRPSRGVLGTIRLDAEEVEGVLPGRGCLYATDADYDFATAFLIMIIMRDDFK